MRIRDSFTIFLLTAGAASSQVFTAEADPDFYFDRGISLSLGVKPAESSRWTILGDFASRKIGPLRNHERLQWRAGAGARYRLFGRRNNIFGQLNLSVDQVHTPSRTTRGPSLRPGLGAQWFPSKTAGFYVAPLFSLDRGQGRKMGAPRLEFRVGWQF